MEIHLDAEWQTWLELRSFRGNAQGGKKMTGKDEAEQYNRYYLSEEDGESHYDKRYGGKITLQTQERLGNTINTILEYKGSTDTLTILDYGCGNGRHFSTIRKLVEMLDHTGIQVYYVGYDISWVGLEQFGEKAIGQGLIKIGGEKIHPITESETKDAGYQGPVLAKGNLKLSLVHCDASDSPEHIKSLLPDADLSLCMNGVLSCIEERRDRQAVLELVGKKTTGRLIFTVPNADCAEDKQKNLNAEYTEKVQKERLEEAIKTGKNARLLEKDDKYIPRVLRYNKTISLFYHLYTLERLREDLKIAGFTNYKIGCDATKPEIDTLNYDEQKQLAEYRLSMNMPPEKLRTLARYFFIEANCRLT